MKALAGFVALLLIVLMGSVAPPAQAITCDELLYGDSNLDGVFDIQDLLLLLDWIDGPPGEPLPAVGSQEFVNSDVNGDLVLNVFDFLLYRDHLVGRIDSFPVENSPPPCVGPKLTVTKVVVNDNGGELTVLDFSLFVDGNPVSSGIENIFSAGAHMVSETLDPRYTATISGDCAADGSITLVFSEVASCTITNDDILQVEIDIKPGSFPNSINLGSGGNVPVAIFSTATFDATTVDPLTVTLAGAELKLKGKGTPMASSQDVDGDGLLDLVVHVNTEALALSDVDTEAVLEGQTSSGLPFRGVDTVKIVP